MEARTLYQSERLWILNKPSGLPFSDAVPQNLREQWEPVHRLDTDTSGCLLCAAPDQGPRLRALFKDRHEAVRKIYLAGASKPLPQAALGLREGLVAARYRGSKVVRWVASGDDAPRGWHSAQKARHSLLLALSVPEALRNALQGTLYEVELLTGARHQIRAYFKSWEAPLRGDSLYGVAAEGGLELHAWKLEITDPETGERAMAEATTR
jgi:tRNA pseudouridine32 synthase/23S rRNA pseudouridine746 synthase